MNPRTFLALLLVPACAATPTADPGEHSLAVAAKPEGPRTAAERSDWRRTSTFGEVTSFLATLDGLPHAARLARHTLYTTNEGRESPLVVVADPMPPTLDDLASSRKLRLLVNANIHGGEVEGKEAVQLLLREFALGEHAALLEHVVVLFVPVYNADGNDRIARTNRVTQNGPEQGVGERANAQGLDLNRDFVKVASPECAGLMEVFRTLDPHLFMDLHTTNGSAHGYHLTYSPSLSTNVDPELDAYAREEWLPSIRAALEERHGYRSFDYGNFTGAGEDRRWATYDHRPRFGTNYHGLRNRLSLLSEAYSYVDFETRVRVTRAFVLETLRACARDADRIAGVCRRADERTAGGDVTFGTETELAPPLGADVLVGAVDEVRLPGDLGVRRVARPGFEVVRMGVQDRFTSRATSALPEGWAVFAPNDGQLRVLDAHGVAWTALERDTELVVSRFELDEVTRATRPFQGHHEVRVRGRWSQAAATVLPAGTLLVPARNRLGRVAAQLLEPESEDSLTTWNAFDHVLGDGAGEQLTHPVLRVHDRLR